MLKSLMGAVLAAGLIAGPGLIAAPSAYAAVAVQEDNNGREMRNDEVNVAKRVRSAGAASAPSAGPSAAKRRDLNARPRPIGVMTGPSIEAGAARKSAGSVSRVRPILAKTFAPTAPAKTVFAVLRPSAGWSNAASAVRTCVATNAVTSALITAGISA